MKILNKQKLQQTAGNHSSSTDFQEFMKPYKKCTAKPCSVLVNNTTLASDNILRFRQNTLQRT